MKRKKKLEFAGYTLSSDGGALTVQRAEIDLKQKGDHGADLLGDGTFRMVPSGDVVDYAERCRRLGRK